jgi:hypothetical protein
MWVIVHALSGLALGALVPLGILLTIICALFLHLLLDLVPHWDYTRDRRRVQWALLDVAVSIACISSLLLVLDLPGRALVAAIVSAAPDLDVFDALLPGAKRRRFFPSHWQGFPHGRAGPVLGVLTQLLVALGALALLILSAE